MVSRVDLKTRNTTGKTENPFQTFHCSWKFFHWNFLNSRQVFHLPVLSNCIFVNGNQRNLALHHGVFVPYQWQAAMGQILPCEQRLHFRGMSWRAKSSYFSNASSYRENVASARRVVKYWTFFIAVPCRCGLRGGYIELVGFNDQLRSRVKTYLSARSCPSTIGQVRIMYVM